jgi:hypothetical protein
MPTPNPSHMCNTFSKKTITAAPAVHTHSSMSASIQYMVRENFRLVLIFMDKYLPFPIQAV